MRVSVLQIALLILAAVQQGCVPEPAVKPQAKNRPEELAARPSAKPHEKAKPAASEKWIPRELLFGNPDKAAARISPDGKRLSYLAPVEGVLNVWVGSPEKPDEARPVTSDKYRGIRSYLWAYDSRRILYTQDAGGDEDWHVYSVDLESRETKDLTPLKKVSAQIEGISDKFPNEILVGLNARDPQYHDIYRVNIATGDRKLVQKNTEFAGFTVDDDFRVRLAMKMLPDGSTQIYKADGKGGWSEWQKIDMADSLTTSPVGFDSTGETLYMLDSRGRDTGALTATNMETDETEVLADDPRTDVAGVLLHPTKKTVQAASFNYLRNVWHVLDRSIADDLKFLESVADGDLEVTSRSLDDQAWTVAYVMDTGPVRNYLYHPTDKKVDFLFTNRKSLEGLPLAKMHPAVIKARDGKELVSFLSLPLESDTDHDGRPDKPLPMVLNVHGGPWARDTWGYDPEHQWLANRGYAVLSVNFRGSTGFGKEFVNAGNKQWARTMHDDLLDAVDWAIAQKVADPARVGIMGGSYGGYATLVALTVTPDKFACGVDIVGPSNLITLLATIPPYWAPALQMFKDRVGDPSTPEGKALLEERSPLNYVEKIRKPLLIGQGANDPRVKQAEADQIIEAMRKKKIPVTYVLFPDEGHGFARPENRLAFYAVTEAFLARQLGGTYQPIGDDFEGSAITVPVGAEFVPGLSEAIKEHQSPQGQPAEPLAEPGGN